LFASQLASPGGASPLHAQTKAQKLRTHAQEKRTGKGGAGFHDQLRARHGGKSEDAKLESRETDDAQNTAIVKKNAGVQKGEVPGAPGSATTSSAATGGEAGNGSSALDGAGKPATSESGEQPFVQEVVAQVLQGVDPALRLKPVELARAAATVAGNTAAAKRSVTADGSTGIEVEPLFASDGGGALGEAAGATTAPSAPEPRADRATPEPTPAAQPKSEARGRAAKGDAPTGSSQAPAARADLAENAVNAAAATAAPTPVVPRTAEQRLTLTPTLAPVQVRAPGRTPSPVGGAIAEPLTQSTVADQVQHGLQVAMNDLPAPAGERLVTMRLHPSSLGSLRISMHVSGDAVSVRFQVGSAKARGAIGKTIDELKASIARQGLRVESMEIEEESALAAPAAAAASTGAAATVSEPASVTGKGFANPPVAPLGSESLGEADGTGRTPAGPDAESEGGVLQVLTFRLDAVG
jgi:flagellar hook-length control protein FliK